jgi:hypothetical protein
LGCLQRNAKPAHPTLRSHPRIRSRPRQDLRSRRLHQRQISSNWLRLLQTRSPSRRRREGTQEERLVKRPLGRPA